MIDGPEISVIVPTYQRCGSVSQLLDALACQNCTNSFEAVVVVDGSTDGTAELIRSLRPVFRCRVLEQENKGQAAARNRGVACSVADVLVFLDDDVIPDPFFIATVTAQIKKGMDVVLGRIEILDEESRSLAWKDAKWWSASRHKALSAGTMAFEHIVFSATAIRRSCFESVGGFMEEFTGGGRYGNEDIELGYRLIYAGAKICYEPNAVVHCRNISTEDDVLEKEYQSGRSDVLFAQLHPEPGAKRINQMIAASRIQRWLAQTAVKGRLVFAFFAFFRRRLTWAFRLPLPASWRFRLWFMLRALNYWSGVADSSLCVASDALYKKQWQRKAPLYK